jgi:hypothetical protein
MEPPPKTSVAVDNSVLSDFTNLKVPANKARDRQAFKQIINLAKEGILEIGMPRSIFEPLWAGDERRQRLEQELGGTLQIWPAVIPATMMAKHEQRKRDLHSIMQDKDGNDSRNLVASLIYGHWYVTTDYRFLRRFRSQAERIRKICSIEPVVLTPSEFMGLYQEGWV